jgi:alpha-ketoglutarate-dependent taurine dioxygenase
MGFETIQVTPLSPHVGAEISGVDLRAPLGNRQVSELHDALIRHLVIFFHDQPIDFDAHKRFARYFGDLHIHVGGDGTASGKVDGHPEIRRQHFDANSKRVSGEVWHTDQSCAAIPPMGSILQQHIVPPMGGGDTLFASMYAAYEALSPRMQGFLEGLTATHDGAKLFDKSSTVYPTAVHPVIARHPATDRKLIYVNRGFTTRINEVPEAESAAVLEFLFQHCALPEFHMRFRWRAHSIAFWDNRASQHQAIWDYWPNVRSGYRVQIKGTEPPRPA